MIKATSANVNWHWLIQVTPIQNKFEYRKQEPKIILICHWTSKIIQFISFEMFMNRPDTTKKIFICFQLQLFSKMQELNNWCWKQTNASFKVFIVGNQPWNMIAKLNFKAHYISLHNWGYSRKTIVLMIEPDFLVSGDIGSFFIYHEKSDFCQTVNISSCWLYFFASWRIANPCKKF